MRDKGRIARRDGIAAVVLRLPLPSSTTERRLPSPCCNSPRRRRGRLAGNIPAPGGEAQSSSRCRKAVCAWPRLQSRKAQDQRSRRGRTARTRTKYPCRRAARPVPLSGYRTGRRQPPTSAVDHLATSPTVSIMAPEGASRPRNTSRPSVARDIRGHRPAGSRSNPANAAWSAQIVPSARCARRRDRAIAPGSVGRCSTATAGSAIGN